MKEMEESAQLSYLVAHHLVDHMGFAKKKVAFQYVLVFPVTKATDTTVLISMNVQALKRTSATSTRFVQTQKDPMSVAALKDIKARDETVQISTSVRALKQTSVTPTHCVPIQKDLTSVVVSADMKEMA